MSYLLQNGTHSLVPSTTPTGTFPASRGPFEGFDRNKYQREKRMRKRRDAFRRTVLFVFFSVLALLIGSATSKAISQAAYDAVQYQSCIQTGC